MKLVATRCLAVLAALLLLSLVLPQVAGAQAPAWVLAQTDPLAATGHTSNITGMAADDDGNILVIGTFTTLASFGSTTLTSHGQEDTFVAKYVPATGTWAWALGIGGTGYDRGLGIAVSGSSVYVTGGLTNDRADSHHVSFADSSTGEARTSQAGASFLPTYDLFVAKYHDHGSSATLGWVQVGGGLGDDAGQAIVASGTSVYVTGFLTNSTADYMNVVFGGNGLAAGTVAQAGASTSIGPDVVLAKYQDHGATAGLVWTQVAGGTGADFGQALALSGNHVYVAGTLSNNTANEQRVVFGGSGRAVGTRPQAGATTRPNNDMFLAKYTDTGPGSTISWTQVGGGTEYDIAHAVAVSGTSVYVTGYVNNTNANIARVVFGGAGLLPGSVPLYGASSGYTTDAFVVKYADAGPTATVQWAQVAGGESADGGWALAVRGTSVYVVLHLTNDQTGQYHVVLGGHGSTPGTRAQPGTGARAATATVLACYTDLGKAATVRWTLPGGATIAEFPAACALHGPYLYVAGLAAPASTFGRFTVAASSSRYTYTYLLAAADLAGAANDAPATAVPLPGVLPHPRPPRRVPARRAR